MKKYFLILTSILLFISINTNAALITVERVKFSSSMLGDDLVGYWNTTIPTSTDFIDDATLLYKGSSYNKTLFKMSVDLSALPSRKLSLFAGLDAGYGAEIFLNNSLVVDENTNLWWRRNWADPHVIELDLNLSLGNNLLEIYWAENFASGGNSFRIFDENIGIQALSTDSLNTVAKAIPLPSTLALLLSALGFIFWSQVRHASH